MATKDLKTQIIGWAIALLFCAAPLSALDWWSSGGAKPGPAGAAGAAGEDVETWTGWTTGGHLVGHSVGSAIVAPYLIPITDGSVNQILKHNGAGALIWAEDGGGDITGHTNATADIHGVTGAFASSTTLTNHTNATADVHGASGAVVGLTTFNEHANATSNPHTVTAAQISAQASDADLTTLSTAGASGTFVHSNGTVNWSSYTLPTTVPTSGNFLHSNGTNMISSTYTLPTSVPAENYILHSNGTNIVGTNSVSVSHLNMSASTQSIPWTVQPNAHSNTTLEGLAHYNSSTNLVTVSDGSSAIQLMSCHTDSLTSSQIATAVTNETGTGNLVFHTNASLTTPDIGAATGTSLTLTGNLGGKVPAREHTSSTVTVAVAEVRGDMHFNSSAITQHYDLPDADGSGQSLCIYSHVNNSLQIDPNGTNQFHLNGSALEGAGYQIVSDGTRGAFVCLMSFIDNIWAVLGSKGTWTGTGAD